MSTLLRHWRIIEVDDEWDFDLDVDGPAQLALEADGRGELSFFLLVATVDARELNGRLEFTWAGQWELDDTSGRGIATPTADGRLSVHLWIHLGDEITLTAITE